MTQTSAEVEEQIKKIQAEVKQKIARLETKKRGLLKKETEASRRRRNHALMTIGAIVESQFDNGWTEVGCGLLARWCAEHAAEIVEACRVENLEPEAADSRLHEWEARQRAARKAAREAARGGAQAEQARGEQIQDAAWNSQQS